MRTFWFRERHVVEVRICGSQERRWNENGKQRGNDAHNPPLPDASWVQIWLDPSCSVPGRLYRIRQTYKDDQHTKHLQHEPAIARNTGVVLEQFSLRSTDVCRDVDGICVYALHGFPLFSHHLRELGEDLAKLCNCRLNGFDRG